MRTVRQIPRAIALGIWLPVSHAPSCIVTTNPSTTGLNPLISCWTTYDFALMMNNLKFKPYFKKATTMHMRSEMILREYMVSMDTKQYINLAVSFTLKGVKWTTWGRDKMDAIFQTTYSNAFSSTKMSEFWLKFHWSVFRRVQLTLFQHWFRQCLGTVQATSHYLNQWWLVYWRIYAALGLNSVDTVKRTPVRQSCIQSPSHSQM